MDRPFGVTVIAFLSIVSGIYNFFVGLALLGYGGFLALGPNGSLAVTDAGTNYLGWFTLLVGVISFAIGLGLWSLQYWAWVTALVTQFVALGLNIINAGYGGLNLLIPAAGLLMTVIMLIYLMVPSVKQTFEQSSSGYAT